MIDTSPRKALLLYETIRQRTEDLCAPLHIEDYVPQPVEFASPPKWHLAHTTWFFEAFILEPHAPNYEIFDADFSYLFNSYYNNAGERILRTDRGNITRPGVEEVYAYRKYVNQAMTHLLENSDDPKLTDLVILGLQHEQQHQELLVTDLKHTLGHNPIFPVYKKDLDLTATFNDTTGWLAMNEGIYEIGHRGESFSYDNELGRHKVFLHDYQINKALVTNGEYLEFIESGAYQNFDLWLDEGWAWVNKGQVNAPLYWHQVDRVWHHYTLAGLKPVDPKAVLSHVSFYEAAAFAEWKGLRLPTEFEWEAASSQLSWGQRWEWTNSAYLPYPNFRKVPGALGEYNGKFMINQMVLRGASVATAPQHSRNTYRNFFHTSARWQYTGIRLAK